MGIVIVMWLKPYKKSRSHSEKELFMDKSRTQVSETKK